MGRLNQLFFILTIAVLVFIVKPLALVAAGEDFLITWKSNGFVPSAYQGKILPAKKSRVALAFEIIKAGQSINLKNSEVRWFVNNKLIGRGVGLKKITLTVSDTNDLAVRISVKGPGKDEWEKLVVIPVARPELIIDGPTIVEGGAKIVTFYGRPFFFNIKSLKDLTFKWRVGGQETIGEVAAPEILEVLIPAELKNTALTIAAAAQNNRDLSQFAKKEINLAVR